MRTFFKKYGNTLLFIAVLVVAIFFRFYSLAIVPPSPSMDEATIGWNAYSLMLTGHDEYGYHLPILLRAYDDYRPALYVYMVIPFIKMLGLSVVAVRLPSVIMSVLTVAMSFFLIRSMFFAYKFKNRIALGTMAIFAISPWHIYLSRLGHEVNLGLTLVVLGVLLFFLFIQHKKGLLLVLSFIVFALGFYSYQSEKLFIPLLVFILLVASYKKLLLYKKHLIVGIILAVVIALPMVIGTFSPTGLIRLKGTSIFTANPAYEISTKKLLIAKEHHDIFGQILANRRVTTVTIFISNYFSHFNVRWLFGSDNNESFKAPGTGLLYLWELPFICLGAIYFFVSKKIASSLKIVVGGWTIVNFIAPAITTQAPHAMRAFTIFPIPPLWDTFGVLILLEVLSKYVGRIISGAFVFLFSVVIVQSIGQFTYNYFQVFPLQDSRQFQYALSKAILFIETNKASYQSIVVSNRKNLRNSYMFYLFETKYDPVRYAKEGGTISGSFSQVHRIDHIIFRPIDWQKETLNKALFVGNPDDFPNPIGPLAIFNYLNGDPGVTIVPRN